MRPNDILVMNRFLSSQLVCQDGVFFNDDEKYNGVVFFEEEDRLIAKNVVDGCIVGDYRPVCLPYGAPDNVPIFNYEYVIEDDYAPIRRSNGEILTGVVCAFEDNGERYEEYIVNGALDEEANWGKDKRLKTFHCSTQYFGECYKWLDNGIQRSAFITTKDDFSVELNFEENGELFSFLSRGGGVRKMDFISRKASFFRFSSLDELINLNWSHRVNLYGSDVDNEVLKYFVEKKALKNVKLLTFMATKIQDVSLLSHLPMLNKLNIETGNDVDANSVEASCRRLKQISPHIDIELNRTRVE